MTKATILMMVALSMILLIGCGNDDDDTGTDTDTDSDTDTDTDSDSDSDTDGELSIDVTYNDETQTIVLSGLVTTTIDKLDVVLLETIIAEFDPAPALDTVTLDFEGSDGWMPGNSDNCVDVVPIDGTLAGQGGVDVNTLDLLWDEAAGLPGCMGVAELAIIYVADI